MQALVLVVECGEAGCETCAPRRAIAAQESIWGDAMSRSKRILQSAAGPGIVGLVLFVGAVLPISQFTAAVMIGGGAASFLNVVPAIIAAFAAALTRTWKGALAASVAAGVLGRIVGVNRLDAVSWEREITTALGTALLAALLIALGFGVRTGWKAISRKPAPES